MPTARPFSYNTGSTITGTEQVGQLAIGTPTDGFESTGLKWWNGPDEDLGYVITHTTPSGNQPNQFSIPAYLGFWRTDTKTDQSFINLAEYVSVQHNDPQNFDSAGNAATWLNNNGYWTSYPTAKRVLFLGDTSIDTVATNISQYITNTGYSITYSAVTMNTTYTGGSDITTDNYDVVFIYTNGGQTGGVGLSNNLVNFVNSGGSVVSGVFLWNVYADGFAHSAVTAFNKTDVQSFSVGSFTVVTPSPITNGIGTSLPSSFSNGNPTLVSGAVQLATFNDGVNCLAAKTVGSSTLVSVNAWPANINSNNSTICKMFGNSILYAAGVI